jgi:hypothetical protein
MALDPTSPDADESFFADPVLLDAVKKFASALDSLTPTWCSNLSTIEKFICSHTYTFDTARLHLPPKQQ